jgi:hypothetical protein
MDSKIDSWQTGEIRMLNRKLNVPRLVNALVHPHQEMHILLQRTNFVGSNPGKEN